MSRARILEPTPENLRLATNALLGDDPVAMPTETVYGLAGIAFHPEALARIFDAKERPTFDPLIIHVPVTALSGGLSALERMGLVDREAMSEIARDRAERLIRAYWPGPLTLVLPKQKRVPDLATAGLPTVAVRMPRHPVAQALLSITGAPLAAPSANRFGRISPTTAAHVAEELGDRIDWILDGGPCTVGLESTVIQITKEGEASMLRPGGVPREEIEKLLGVGVSVSAGVAEQAAAASPGMLESHYAPLKSLTLLGGEVLSLKEWPYPKTDSIGVLLLSGDPDVARAHLQRLTGSRAVVRSLSAKGDLAEAAKNLFAELRALDHSGAEALFAEPCSSAHGLGHAIADRLRRASAKRSY